MFDFNPYGICAFLISTLLLIAYFSKKRINSVENRIYSVMVIASFFGSIISIFTYLITAKYQIMPPYLLLIPRLYVIYLIIWGTSFSLYIIYISINDLMKGKWYYIRNTFIAISFFISSLVLVLPINYVNNENGVYTSGLSVYIAYILAIVYLITSLLFMIYNIRNIVNKKYISILSFIVLIGITILIQFINPQLLIITFVVSFNTLLMYFTIENPDVILLKEYENIQKNNRRIYEEKELFILNVSQRLKISLLKIKQITDDCIKTSSINSSGYREINEISSNLVSIIDENLNINNIEMARLRIQNTNYNPNISIHIMSKMFESNIKRSNKNIKLIKDFANNLPNSLYGDETRIKQIIKIVFANALKYTKDGGAISFTVICQEKNDICQLHIIIKDNGVGIESSKLDLIIDQDSIYKYGKVDESKENLALCKTLLSIMGGSLIIDSKPNFGTTVKIIIDQKMSASVDKQISLINNNVKKYFKKFSIGIISEDIELVNKLSKILIIDKLEIDHNCIRQIKKKRYYDVIIVDENIHRFDQIWNLILENNYQVLLLTKDISKSKDNKFIKTLDYDLIDRNILKEIKKMVIKKI